MWHTFMWASSMRPGAAHGTHRGCPHERVPHDRVLLHGLRSADGVRPYFDELAQVRGMLDNRYEDLKSGKVKPIDGAVFFELRACVSARKNCSNSVCPGERSGF